MAFRTVRFEDGGAERVKESETGRRNTGELAAVKTPPGKKTAISDKRPDRPRPVPYPEGKPRRPKSVHPNILEQMRDKGRSMAPSKGNEANLAHASISAPKDKRILSVIEQKDDRKLIQGDNPIISVEHRLADKETAAKLEASLGKKAAEPVIAPASTIELPSLERPRLDQVKKKGKTP